MSKMKNSLFALVLCSLLFGSRVCMADDADIFVPAVTPDLLLLLDLSGSMNSTPAGGTLYASSCSSGLINSNSIDGPYYNAATENYTVACTQPWRSRETAAIWGDSQCLGPFYKTSGTGHTRNCSKIQLAKDAIKSLLDADGNGTVVSPTDDNLLGVRIGYGNFYAQPASAPSNTTTYINVNPPVKQIGSNYSDIWTAINGATCDASTPDAALLDQAKTYLDANKAADPAGNCRNKFALLITDGSDTTACSGTGDENASDQYKRRRETVAKAKALGDAGYRLYVVGFGAAQAHYLRNTLNWAAFFGGTDNPSASKSGDTTAYVPSRVTSCQTDSTATHDLGDGTHYYATANDPGELSLSGYAFAASDAASLQTALETALGVIRNSAFSFSATYISSSRTAMDNLAYAASFQPKGDPFWLGFLRESTINTDGSLTPGWEAGSILNGNTSRNMSTYVGGQVTPLPTSSWGNWKDYFGVQTGNAVQAVVGYIRGDSGSNPDGWKLGDIIHSNPIAIGKPNPYFEDPRDTNMAYDAYRKRSDIISNSIRPKIVIAGANDGQLHAFNGSTGGEVWSFIPPNLLPKLQYLAHTNDPSTLPHQFFVDGPISAGDVWTGTGTGTAKLDSEWRTYLVFGEGKGVRDNASISSHTSYLWSSSQYCDLNFNPSYVWSSMYNHYCGYHALDVTATGSTPVYKWIINTDPATKQMSDPPGSYLGEPWSRMAIGRVLDGGNEEWVGFIGGGYGQSGNAGKGFFAIDLRDGHILWKYTNGDNSGMNAIPASPMIVDTDNDGFIDTAYVGDLSGNVWRFTFCTRAQAQAGSCGTGDWRGGLFFQPSSTSSTVPIYTAATFARDWDANLWVFWGTGDKMSPNSTGSGSSGKFYAVKDSSRSGTYGNGNLQDITGGLYTNSTTQGWVISLSSRGEKVLSDPTVFGGMLLFTTYVPYAGTNPCVTAGTSYLYALAMQKVSVPGATYNTGAGLLDSGARSLQLGSGIASAPIIAQSSPGAVTSFFVSVSGGAGVAGGSGTATTSPTVTKTKLNFDANSGLVKRLGQTGLSTQIIHWRDGRIQ